MKDTICLMCSGGVTIGKNGYRCQNCDTAVCNHSGYGNKPFCPNCVPSATRWVPAFYQGKAVWVIDWHIGQFATIKPDFQVAKDELTYPARSDTINS
jgi:hypothetical protein